MLILNYSTKKKGKLKWQFRKLEFKVKIKQQSRYQNNQGSVPHHLARFPSEFRVRCAPRFTHIFTYPCTPKWSTRIRKGFKVRRGRTTIMHNMTTLYNNTVNNCHGCYLCFSSTFFVRQPFYCLDVCHSRLRVCGLNIKKNSIFIFCVILFSLLINYYCVARLVRVWINFLLSSSGKARHPDTKIRSVSSNKFLHSRTALIKVFRKPRFVWETGKLQQENENSMVGCHNHL